jgi:aryl-alcohol dehydrogenase-like predicted oxidoreductase
MEYRRLGACGLHVPALSFGAATFGGRGSMFSAWGDTDLKQARNMVDICLDAGVTMFDVADVYSEGESERLLGAAIAGRRDRVLLSTKAGTPTGSAPWEMGTSRSRLIRSVDGSLRRLGVDHIDLFQLHAFDAGTPVEEVLGALDDLVRAGKIRYVGASNFTGWQLMKSLAAAEARGFPRYVAHQVYYSLAGRDYEWELLPLGHDQGVGAVVYSPLCWGRLTGKFRRGAPPPAEGRLSKSAAAAPPIDEEQLFDLVDVLDEIAAETGKTIPQIALNWLLTRPTVATVIVGARNEAQLRENLGAVGWRLETEQLARLDKVSAVNPPYPYFLYYRLRGFKPLNPPLV